MRNLIPTLCVGVALAAPAIAQSSKPPLASKASRSVCATLAPKSLAFAGANDPFANMSEREVERQLRREAPRRALDLDLAALMSCLTAEMSAGD